MNRVQYDKNGNIIIQVTQDTNKKIELIGGFSWNVSEPKTQEVPTVPTIKPVGKPTLFAKIFKKINSAPVQHLQAAKQQTQYTTAEFKAWQATLKQEARQHKKNIWQTLCTPIWLLRANKPPKKYNRLQLFIADTFRFGATFGFIFGVLFVGLNYESFWQIAEENLNPIASAQKEIELTKHIGSILSPTSTMAMQNKVEVPQIGNLLAQLPAVGPPENRIIIPSLGINAPLATPSYDALLKEDWVQLEKDIQESLMQGVVHYPGTARPGQAGNFFITGHSSYYAWAPGKYKSIFAKLGHLQVGDEYFVYYGGDKHRYVVTEKKEVKPDNVDVLDQPLSQRISTLMTCTPVGTTLRRLILVAQEIDSITGEVLAVGEESAKPAQQVKPQMLPI